MKLSSKKFMRLWGGKSPPKANAVIDESIEKVRLRIRNAAIRVGRDPKTIQLIAITKSVPLENIRQALALGVTDIGENRVQEALAKFKILGTRDKGQGSRDKRQNDRATSSESRATVFWHMIGHLQTNKVSDAVEIFDWINSVDSLRLAERINKAAQKRNKVMPILIQVKLSDEKSKYGVTPDEVLELASATESLKAIQVEGLMTMAPIVSDPDPARPYFRKLAKLRVQLREQNPSLHYLSHLSMGMSQDFEVAIEEGATMVRVGSAIFHAS